MDNSIAINDRYITYYWDRIFFLLFLFCLFVRKFFCSNSIIGITKLISIVSKPIKIVVVVVVFFCSKTLVPKINVWPKTRPSSDSEAATMYKLKGQSSNM